MGFAWCGTKAFDAAAPGFLLKNGKKWQNWLAPCFFACFLLFGCKKYEADDFYFTFLGFMVDFELVFNRLFVIHTPKNQE